MPQTRAKLLQDWQVLQAHTTASKLKCSLQHAARQLTTANGNGNAAGHFKCCCWLVDSCHAVCMLLGKDSQLWTSVVVCRHLYTLGKTGELHTNARSTLRKTNNPLPGQPNSTGINIHSNDCWYTAQHSSGCTASPGLHRPQHTNTAATSTKAVPRESTNT